MPFSRPQLDTSKVTLPTIPRSPKEASGDGKMSSPASEFDDQRSNADGKVSESSDKRSNEDDNASENSDQNRNADAKSRRSSTSEYEQESFETYQHKVAQLCHDIGYGEPSKIERMKGGGYNRTIGLTLPSGQQRGYVLRIPRSALEEVLMGEIKDQVAVTLHLSKYEFLHVPVIAAFDTTVNNTLECQYVLQERIDGVALDHVFYTLPLAEKLQITTAVAEMLVQLESITLEKPGRLVGTGDLPDRSDVAPTSANEIKITGYRENPIEDLPSMEKQSLASLITYLLELRKQKNLDWDEMVERCERLQSIVKDMDAAGLIRSTDDECVLWHWDLSAGNVMIHRANITASEQHTVLGIERKQAVQVGPGEGSGVTASPVSNDSPGKWVVSGVLDWDDAISVPLVIARTPPSWLWLDEDTRGPSWDGDRDAKPERDLTEDELLIKAHFDQIMAKASPSYIEDAYHRGPLLRSLAEFALYNFEDGVYWDKYDDFVKKWEEYDEALAK
jgi:hypothetical protein